MSEKDWSLLNGLALAYIGDAAYEVYIREHLMRKGWTKPNDLHRRATHYVSAKAQAQLMHAMIAEEGFLTETEMDIYRRGRNAKSHTIAKNADVTTYRISTGFEALFGFLHLTKQIERFEALVWWCIAQVEDQVNE
ncbi:Mini-ribonuclease 3 [Jeotgalibaca dankookensis]|uniref:Mini-ribonuclease 3 n=2 Tax=Jeotgalibaca dankookensis TaxID=708126 RepID=A0A1S6IRF6_9LACT|nr:Mini-ribonuclease 3 [Jeotgalibaca dankookensis]AQS54132.1 Mini-ribonuclease 3 [Jeotgalibaca dankookensis]